MEIFNKLLKICETKQNVNLKTLCTIKIGGTANYVCYPKNCKEVTQLVRFLNKNKILYYVIGNGSNIIFEDAGFNGVIISLKNMHGFKIGKNKITAESGLNLFALNFLCLEHELAGFEWSYGIPATVGGAIFMNAGAYGKEIKDFVKYVWVLKQGKVKKIKCKHMGFGYRTSRVQGTKDIILKASFVLQKGESEDIMQKQKQIFAYRKCCQPYNSLNAGSIFKKMNGESVGKTIDKLGLKSVKMGNIQISELHANFFVNLGNGTSEDVHNLIDFVKSIVLERTGNLLEEEIIFVGNKKGKI